MNAWEEEEYRMEGIKELRFRKAEEGGEWYVYNEL